MVGVGVLADVQRGQVQAERGDRADRRASSRPSADELAAVREQRVAHDGQVVEQLGGVEVVAARLVRAAAGDACAGVDAASARMQVSFSRYGSSALSRR